MARFKIARAEKSMLIAIKIPGSSGRRDHEVPGKNLPAPRPVKLKLRDLKARSMSALLPEADK
jgi:hypothetical protein